MMGSFGFLIDLIFRQHYGPGVESAFNLNENQEYLREVKAADAWGWPYRFQVPIV